MDKKEPELIGQKLGQLGLWYDEVVEVLDRKGRKALVKLRADDGYISYATLLQNDFLEWHINVKSSAKDAAEEWYYSTNFDYEGR